MRIGAALACGGALIAVALAVTLSHAPTTSTRARSVPPETQLVISEHESGGCQTNELLPRDTSAVRIGLFAVTTPEVAVRVYAGSRIITRGTLPPGWSGEGATVPVAALARAVVPVTVCFAITSLNGNVTMVGRTAPPAEATIAGGRRLPGRVSIEYLQPGHRSWWSLAVATARHLGLGRAGSGTWNALLVLALAATVLALSSWLVVRDLR